MTSGDSGLTHEVPAFPGYRVERELGSGGMATVYLAEDLKHRRRVAVKVIEPEVAQAIGGERFLKEIDVTARLSHPNILPLFDSGSSDGRLYYVMPFVAGETLRARLAREQRMAIDDAVRLTKEMASALVYAHEQGTVHRDIKPENILLSAGIALLADFGIAHSIRAAAGTDQTIVATTIGSMVGTPGYMSPEQISGAIVDARTDLYALACVLFEMLAGQPPFVAATADALFRAHLTAPARRVTELRPDVPPALSDVIARGLAKAPADRFETATAFAEAIAAAASASGAGSAGSHNLPRLRTQFVGRERELAECSRLLDEAQLLTITGIGGGGKTRLALQLAERLLGRFPGGVWFVDLALVADGDRVRAALAAAIGVREMAGEDPVETIKTALQGKRVLVMFDNCEHVLPAVATLANHLLSLDGVQILATSREGIGIDGERLFALRSLGVPSLEAERNVDELREVDAVKLFVDRARLAVHDFALTGTNAPAVADICRRLDGIPLAIELAAARIRVLPAEQIRAKLDDRFKLLTGGSKVALARHQTLRATLQWSYDLLTPAERQLLRALSVFAGGWTLAHATRVWSQSGDEFDTLDLLGRLIEKSLVLLERDRSGEPRYGLLETVRQYARDGLNDAGEATAVRARHAATFMDLAARGYHERFEKEQHWTVILETEHDNLRAALEFLRDSDAGKYLELAGALAWFWQTRSHLVEGPRAPVGGARRGAGRHTQPGESPGVVGRGPHHRMAGLGGRRAADDGTGAADLAPARQSSRGGAGARGHRVDAVPRWGRRGGARDVRRKPAHSAGARRSGPDQQSHGRRRADAGRAVASRGSAADGPRDHRVLPRARRSQQRTFRLALSRGLRAHRRQLFGEPRPLQGEPSARAGDWRSARDELRSPGRGDVARGPRAAGRGGSPRRRGQG